MSRETERIRRIYDRAAPTYDGQLDRVERLLLGDGRVWACSLAHGNVLEIGIGTGRNLPLYAADVLLTGIDVSPAMLEVARRRAAPLGRRVDLRLGDAQTLPFGDQSFDCVVSTLVFCTIPDPGQAVTEIRRVLRPAGRLLLLEHVRSPIALVRLIQMVLDPIFVRFLGDHLLREPADMLKSAGFRVEELSRSRWGVVERIAARS